ncbi:MAG: hypothetical protein JAY75_19635, partial [Candidatus Thiodiazotropha taylori]|nr:hypothetical protein [Candidatus Thiodiazotropha taylori]MCW4310432.1 hypothetical protein [Candidatus Thiodiazotropha endolucinida]
MAEIMDVKGIIAKYGDRANIQVPTNAKRKARWQKKPLEEWKRLPFSGEGVSSFSGKKSNSWNTWEGSDAKHYSEADYITALKLRSNTFPCRAVMAKAGGGDPTCRQCHQTVETIGHISGHCPSVKKYRIKRHDIIANKIGRQGDAESGTGIWKPEMMLVEDRKAVV